MIAKVKGEQQDGGIETRQERTAEALDGRVSVIEDKKEAQNEHNTENFYPDHVENGVIPYVIEQFYGGQKHRRKEKTYPSFLRRNTIAQRSRHFMRTDDGE